MIENNNLNEQQLIDIAGGTGNASTKYQAGDIFGYKYSNFSYVYGVIIRIIYNNDGRPHSYVHKLERDAFIWNSFATIENYEMTTEKTIEDFEANTKKFDKLPEPGSYHLNYEYFF